MKTMMNLDGTQIVRVSDEKASRLFGEGYKYITKSIWKEKVRDVEILPESYPTKKKSKATKRHLRKSK